MKRNYPYLLDETFRNLVDRQKLQNQFLKLTLLDWDENPLEEIQGIATGGTISLNGSSAIRRTCSLTMTVKDVSTGKITDTKNLISINKKVFIEIGIKNTTKQYTDYPILWYPQGVFIFTSCSVSTGVNQATTLSAQLKDKMCLLNGECGGMITSAVRFDIYDTLDEENGQIITKRPVISQIIRELVNHFGCENLSKIIIHDISDKIKQPMRWLGINPLFLITKNVATEDGTTSVRLYTTNEAEAIQSGGVVQQFAYGMDVGFTVTDFTYPGELTANAGDNVCTILDKIISTLGNNYEYYYDIWGNFILQEIKNYLNTTQAKVELDKMSNNSYLLDMAKGKSTYGFLDGELITNYSNNPYYNRIKNDYVVWGIRTDTNDLKVPIRYHLAIDKKPNIGNIYDIFMYNDQEDGLTKAKYPIKYPNITRFPYPGVDELFYMSENTGIIYKWDSNRMLYVAPNGNLYEEHDVKEAPIGSGKDEFPSIGSYDIIYISTSDNKQYVWRLVPGSNHYQGVVNELNTLYNNYLLDKQPYLDDIDLYNSEIKELEEEISELGKDGKTLRYLTERNKLIKEKNSLIDEQQYLTNEIQEFTVDITNDNYTINLKQNEILQLQQDIITETDPQVRYEMETRIASLESDIELLQLDVNNKTNIINSDTARLTDISTRLNEIEVAIDPLNTALHDYDIQVEDKQERIETCKTLIDGCNEVIDAYTETYENDKAELLLHQPEYVEFNDFHLTKIKVTDWRSELYLQGVLAEPLGLASNYYYPELAAEWPKLYNLQANNYIDSMTGDIIYTGDFYEDVKENPWNVNYWLDFLDSDAAISQFNISNIGRRSLVESNNDYNCIFEPEIPDVIIIETDTPDTDKQRQLCEKQGQDYCQVRSDIFDLLIIGGMNNSCFNRIKELLWNNTNYNSSINLTTIPIYHLESNIRITVQSEDADIHGDFMIDSISIPLTINGTMSISASQVQTKL